MKDRETRKSEENIWRKRGKKEDMRRMGRIHEGLNKEEKKGRRIKQKIRKK